MLFIITFPSFKDLFLQFSTFTRALKPLLCLSKHTRCDLKSQHIQARLKLRYFFARARLLNQSPNAQRCVAALFVVVACQKLSGPIQQHFPITHRNGELLQLQSVLLRARIFHCLILIYKRGRQTKLRRQTIITWKIWKNSAQFAVKLVWFRVHHPCGFGGLGNQWNRR